MKRLLSILMVLPVFALVTACDPGDHGEAYDEAELALSSAASNACPGLLRAWANVCPDKPSCPVIEWQLERRGCLATPEVECPCEPDTWYYNPGFNGVYCYDPVDWGRLSVCGPEGDELCTSNYGTTSEMEVDPAICAACREQFPVQAWHVTDAYYVTVHACGDVSGGAVIDY